MGEAVRSNFVAAQPVGERCSHGQLVHDQRPDNYWCLDIVAARNELRALHENTLDPRLTDAEHAEYAAQMHELMLKARLGVVSTTGRRPEGAPIRTIIFELKPRIQTASLLFGREPPHLRLYLGEPATEPRKLVALKVAAKAQGVVGLAEQDEHIDEAVGRAHEWAGRPVTPAVTEIEGAQG